MINIGFKTVLQGSVVILVFAYIALGPYSAIYQQALDQVKAPVEIAFRAVKNAFYDIYLLATNPTEWYARQQVINTRPEKPISFPKALEVTSLDVTPPSVPGGQPFVLNAVLRNDGDLAVRNIRVTAACNQWCQTPLPKLSTAEETKFSLCVDYTLRNEFWCAESCDQYAEKPDSSNSYPKYTADNCVNKCKDAEDGKFTEFIKTVLTLGTTVNLCNTKDAKTLTQGIYFSHDKYERGEADIVTVEPFVSKTFSGREAETRIAKVYLNVSFDHSTTSQLFVTVISEQEKQRLIKERKLEFKPVVATAKVSPAKLSLNVGPQPLQASTQEQPREATLLVSVSNDRDDSRILLAKGTKIAITLPKEIGSNLRCLGSSETKTEFIDANGKNNDGTNLFTKDSPTVVAEKLIYSIQPEPGKERIEILPFEFNTVFVFICKFDVSSTVDTQKTGIITANLTSYRFVHTLTKDVPVTTPLGILFDPYESYCNGVASQSNCYARSDSDPRNVGTCYYEDAGAMIKRITGIGNTCHSCGLERKCEKFLTKVSCEQEAGKRCGLGCEWDTNAKHPISGADIQGACKLSSVQKTGDTKKLQYVALSGTLAQRIVQASVAAKPSLNTVDADIRAEGLGDSFEELALKIAKVESSDRKAYDFRHCCAEAGKNRYNTCADVPDTTCSADQILESYDGSSVGVMQIYANAENHKDKAFSAERVALKKPAAALAISAGCGNSETVYDLNCNIKLGIKILIDSYNANKNGRQYTCINSIGSKNVFYTGWSAAVRGYNGFGCGTGTDTLYVDRVKKADVSAYTSIIKNPSAPLPAATSTDWSINNGIKGSFTEFNIKDSKGNNYNLRFGIVEAKQDGSKLTLSIQGQNLYNNQWNVMDCISSGASSSIISYNTVDKALVITQINCDVDTGSGPNIISSDFVATTKSFDVNNKNVYLDLSIP